MSLWQRINRSPWTFLVLMLFFATQSSWPEDHGAVAVVNTVCIVMCGYFFWQTANKKWGRP